LGRKRQLSWIDTFCPEGFAWVTDNIDGKPVANMAGLKEAARKHLPRNSILRKLVESEPDTLDKEKALAKIEIFVQLLYEEMKK
jgi:hypothetical protein